MFIKNNLNSYTILIVEQNKEINKRLYYHLDQYGYSVLQVFSEKKAKEIIDKHKNNIQLTVLNIDNDKQTKTNLFEYIQSYTKSKIILLSQEDKAIQREEFFQKGILDYHLLATKTHHISHDIHSMIQKFQSNNDETILLLEECPKLSFLVQNILQARGYQVVHAKNAQEGLDILRNTEVSLLILNMELCDIDGLDFLEGLRDLYLLNEFLVLALSSSDNPSLVRDTLKGGATNFLKKPFLFEEFLLKVDILVQNSKDRRNVTKQKRQIENNLRSFRALLHATIHPMFIFEENICIDCNNEALQILEVSSLQSLEDKHINSIFKDVSNEHKKELLDYTVNHFFEDIFITISGKTYEVQVNERNVIIGKKQLKIVALVDITRIKRDEKILAQQSKMASMGEMIGNIAHQWRQPLNAISIAASGIKFQHELGIEEKEDTLKELDNIVSNTEFLSNTIEDFQNFLKNNRLTSSFPIESAINKTLSIIRANIVSKDIVIKKTFFQNPQIYGVQNDLIQVFLNIINNSIDQFEKVNIKKKRVIQIQVRVDQLYTIIDIFDSAQGIDLGIIDKIFEPYFTTKHQSRGTGLGLYMSHQICQRIGGDISVKNQSFYYENEPLQGACFCIKVPLQFS